MFYDLLLPVLRRLGPARGDAILGFLGRLAMAVRPRRGKRLRAALERASTALDADWPIETTWPALAANTARFLARDYPLDRQSDEAVLEPIRRPRLRAPARDAVRRPRRDPGRQPPGSPHRRRALAVSPRRPAPAAGAAARGTSRAS